MSTDKNLQEARDQFSSEPSIQKVSRVRSETIQLVVEPITRIKSTIGNSWIVGSPTNGLVGTNTGTQGGSQQVVGGSGRAETVEQVLNINRTAYLRFQYTNLNDTSNTTCTWSGNGELSFTTTEIAQSLAIYKDTSDVVMATITVDDSTNLTAELSADGGSNWESVSFGVEHTFSNTGTDLRFKLTASGVATVTFLKVEYNN